MSTTAELIEPQATDRLASITKVESEIIRMRNDFLGLKIKDIYDKAGLAKVSAARKEVKGIRVQVDKARKELVDDAVKWQRQVNDKAKEITAELLSIENPLQEMEEAVENEKKRVREEAERLLKERTEKRNTILVSLGAFFDGSNYTLGDASIKQFEVGGLTDDDFQTKVELFEAEYQKALEIKLEAERVAKEEAEQLEAQRKQQEAEAAELKRQQDEFKAQQAEFERQKVESQKAIDEQNALKEAELKRQQEEIDAQKREVVAKAESERMAKEAEQKEAERKLEIEKARAEAAENEKLEAALKAKQEAEAKVEAERLAKEKEARKLARRPDLEKFETMFAQVNAIINSYSFKTEDFVLAHKEVKTGIELLQKANNPKAE